MSLGEVAPKTPGVGNANSINNYPSNKTLDVANGGLGVSSLTTYTVLCGGTTSTASIQQVSGTGTSGQVLTSNGPGALPTWQTAGGGGSGFYTLDGTQQTASSATSLAYSLNNSSYTVWEGYVYGQAGTTSNGTNYGNFTLKINTTSSNYFLNSYDGSGAHLLNGTSTTVPITSTSGASGIGSGSLFFWKISIAIVETSTVINFQGYYTTGSNGVANVTGCFVANVGISTLTLGVDEAFANATMVFAGG
jgi:hypothetical protein